MKKGGVGMQTGRARKSGAKEACGMLSDLKTRDASMGVEWLNRHWMPEWVPNG